MHVLNTVTMKQVRAMLLDKITWAPTIWHVQRLRLSSEPPLSIDCTQDVLHYVSVSVCA